jgi:hypothetical protein
MPAVILLNNRLVVVMPLMVMDGPDTFVHKNVTLPSESNPLPDRVRELNGRVIVTSDPALTVGNKLTTTSTPILALSQ